MEMQCVAPHEFAVTPHLPNFAQRSLRKALAASAATEDDDIAAEKTGICRELDCRLAPQPSAVEQDCLGRKEFEGRTGTDRQLLGDRRGQPGRTVNLFGSRRGAMCRCSGCK